MARINYEFNLTDKLSEKKLEEFMYLISHFWNTKRFREFIADKCLKELFELSEYLPSYLYLEHSRFDDYVAEYIRNHKKEVGSDYVLLFNDTTIYPEDSWWSDKTKQNYSDGLSVSYIIEYGTGLLGDAQEDWVTNVHNYDERGWWYKNPDTGLGKRTTGLEGQYIYLQLMDSVKENFADWVVEYANKIL